MVWWRNNKQKNIDFKKLLKKRRFWLILGLIIIAVIIFSVNSPLTTSAPTPEQAALALDNTFAATSYRFTTRSTVYLDQAERIFSQLSGERSGENRHISGEVLGTPVNIYYVDNAIFQQSSIDKSWRQVAEVDLEEARQLIAEITPEINFQFHETGEIIYIGTEEIDNQLLHRLELSPVMADNWLERYFDNIHCIIWLDKNGQYIVRARFTAVSTENPSVWLTIENTFSDFNQPLTIEAPI